jgi:hypothetical protein
MSQIALEHGATIDKYVGDAIVIFFGDPETLGIKEDAIACVTMAIAMRKRMVELESIWMEAGLEKILAVPHGHQHRLVHCWKFWQRGSDGLHDHRRRREPRRAA